jgi:hypothetical protein
LGRGLRGSFMLRINMYTVMPTMTNQTMKSPQDSLSLNIPDKRNQRSAAVQITIQSTPYHGLLIFFIHASNAIVYRGLMPTRVPAGGENRQSKNGSFPLRFPLI